MKQLYLLAACTLIGACAIAQSQQPQLQPSSTQARMDGLQKRKSMERESLIKSIRFRNVGPSIMSGRVVDVDVNPDKSTEFYVAYATGGIWYTNNNGQSFTPVFDSLDHLFIGDIAVDWKSGTIYAGTGEVNASRSTYAGTGVFKSTNGGKTWQYLGLNDTHHIGKVVISPTDPNTVWVAAMGHLYSPNKDRGVYKTSDGGKTWSKTLYIDDKTGAIDIEIDPSNPSVLYAATWYRTRTRSNFEEGGPTTGIYKSTDGGNKWTLVTKPGAGFPTGAGAGRIGLAVYPKNPKLVYAVIDNNEKRPARAADSSGYTLQTFQKITKEQFAQLDSRKLTAFLRQNRFPEDVTDTMVKQRVAEGKLKPTVLADFLHDANSEEEEGTVKGAEIYKSSDGGMSWKKTNNSPLDAFSSYGYYLSKVWVSPTDSNKLAITGVPLSFSDDGGKTWRSNGGSLVHSDHHALWFDPKDDKHILNGNDGGLNMSYDGGANWSKLNVVPVGQFYSVVVDNARPYNVYGGLQDNGTWFGPSTNTDNSNWHSSGDYPFKNLNGGDGMMVQVDTRTNNVYYSGSQFGNYSRTNKERTQSLPIHPGHKLGESPLRWNWESPILLSKFNQDILYMASNKFHRSMNKGEKMETLSGDLTKGAKPGDVPIGTCTWIAESPMNAAVLYVGTDDGLVQFSKDSGYHWMRISDKLPQDLWVTTVTASRFKPGRVYVSLNAYRYDNFNPYLYVSEDYGTTWKSINGNLPPEPINTVKEDPKNENLLYVGTDGGLYASLDGGVTYMPFAGGLPRVPVHDIAIQERDNDIVLGTHGRSFYIASLDAIQKLTPEVMLKPAELFDIREVQVASFGRFGGGGGGGRFGARTVANINYYAKKAGSVTFRIKDDKGQELNTVTRNTEPGLNLFEYDLSTADRKTLSAGTYQVEIEAEGTKASKPLVVRTITRQQREEAKAAAGESEENELDDDKK